MDRDDHDPGSPAKSDTDVKIAIDMMGTLRIVPPLQDFDTLTACKPRALPGAGMSNASGVSNCGSGPFESTCIMLCLKWDLRLVGFI